MAIDTLPDPPSRAEPADFSNKADEFLTALVPFGDQCNDVALAMNLNDTSSTSTTSLTIGTGSQSLTVDASKSFLVGMYIQIARTSDPENWMHALITSYTYATGALTVEVDFILGSGTYTDWTITYSSPITQDPLIPAYESTMSGDEDVEYIGGLERTYVYDPDGADRDLTVLAGFPTGYKFWILNIGSGGETVYFDGTPVGANDKQLFIYNGSSIM